MVSSWNPVEATGSRIALTVHTIHVNHTFCQAERAHTHVYIQAIGQGLCGRLECWHTGYTVKEDYQSYHRTTC
jgi:hypothetical protein